MFLACVVSRACQCATHYFERQQETSLQPWIRVTLTHGFVSGEATICLLLLQNSWRMEIMTCFSCFCGWSAVFFGSAGSVRASFVRRMCSLSSFFRPCFVLYFNVLFSVCRLRVYYLRVLFVVFSSLHSVRLVWRVYLSSV